MFAASSSTVCNGSNRRPGRCAGRDPRVDDRVGQHGDQPGWCAGLAVESKYVVSLLATKRCGRSCRSRAVGLTQERVSGSSSGALLRGLVDSPSRVFTAPTMVSASCAASAPARRSTGRRSVELPCHARAPSTNPPCTAAAWNNAASTFCAARIQKSLRCAASVITPVTRCPAGRRAPPMARFDADAALRALSHPRRRQMLEFVADVDMLAVQPRAPADPLPKASGRSALRWLCGA